MAITPGGFTSGLTGGFWAKVDPAPDPPEIVVVDNNTGTSIIFSVSDASGLSMVILYRLLGAAAWLSSSTLNNPELGDQITISGLTPLKVYEFVPFSYSK